MAAYLTSLVRFITCDGDGFISALRISLSGGDDNVAMVERICVREKRWITSEEFLHGLAFGQM